MRACWCGNIRLDSFSPEYSACSACHTLISLKSLSDEQLRVADDDSDFYGKEYWLGHQSTELGFPDIYKRARNDFTERNLHWLRAMLKYRLPPAKVMELGCSHGGFVALLRLAGYDAFGVEMSPWVVDYAKETFGVPVVAGPVESVDVAPGSLDVIVLMDVLEHLADPEGTMRHCLTLLKPDGLLLIQTPEYQEGMSHASMMEAGAPFLGMLIPKEHIYLFSAGSARRLFRQLGADYIQFEPAIFGQYDMFFAVSRVPFSTNTLAQVEEVLLSTPPGRIAQGLLDLRERELELGRRLAESEADRAARFEQITTLTAMLQKK